MRAVAEMNQGVPLLPTNLHRQETAEQGQWAYVPGVHTPESFEDPFLIMTEVGFNKAMALCGACLGMVCAGA